MASQLRGLVSKALKKFIQGKETSPCKGMPGIFNQQSQFESDQGWER